MPTFSSFDGLEIFYAAHGTGPAVLLIHGSFTDSERGWTNRGIADKLQAAGHLVVMMDCRGHGRSAKPHDPAAYTGDAMARDAQALADHLGLDPMHVIGYSMGSRVAARLALLDQRVRSLVLGGCGDAAAGGPSAAWVADVLEVEDPDQLDAPGPKQQDQRPLVRLQLRVAAGQRQGRRSGPAVGGQPPGPSDSGNMGRARHPYRSSLQGANHTWS